jgi:very-short-patch-repair endonuclease
MTVDRCIAQIASAQHGIVTNRQMRERGLDPRTIRRRVRRGSLHPVHRGVYAVGHELLPPLGREMAAVLACGEGACLSHHSAAAIWGFRPGTATADVDVTITGAHCGARQSVRLHRVIYLPTADATRRHTIPITIPARTLLDIAPELDARELERAFDEALVRGVITLSSVDAMLARNPRRRGCVRIRAMAEASRGTTMTRSAAEELFLGLVRRARLAHPEVNARLGRFEVDFLWREAGLVVEVDGYAFHRSRGAFERDRQRDGELGHAGYQVMRVTWRALKQEPEALLVQVASALAIRRARRPAQ